MDKKMTYAEAILVESAIKDSKVFKDPKDLKDPRDLKDAAKRILVAGNRSGGVAVAAMRRWPEAEVIAHAFDYHHARAIRKRLLDEGLPARNVRCAAGVGVEDGAYDLAFFMTTPQSMPAELALDQIQDIHANLSDGGTLYAAFEGDPDDALKMMRLVWKTVNVLKRAKHAVLFKAVKHGPPVKTRDFSSTWEASVPGGKPLAFTTYPGCFCHRRPDAGGLALAEVAVREVECRMSNVQTLNSQLSTLNCLNMGCGCGLVGLLVADAIRRQSSILNPQSSITLIDSYARAIAAAKVNAARAGIEAEFILSDDGLPRGRVGEYDLFVGNPPYYSDYRIAEVFLETAYRALKPGGICLTVVKTATGLLALQEKYFRKAEIIKRRGYCVLRSIR